ncbi:transposase domain-containing protein [Pseudomonas lactucae]|uniref:transposase domain-containing protein n=1 Tax=Pseudomonas lactucae TaxID=2813360 RepID=UPI003CC6D730
MIGRKNWLFSDTPKGATASAQLYSLVETAKANGQEPYAWLRHALERLPAASSIEDYEALLPWNCSLASPSRERATNLELGGLWSAYSSLIVASHP